MTSGTVKHVLGILIVHTWLKGNNLCVLLHILKSQTEFVTVKSYIKANQRDVLKSEDEQLRGTHEQTSTFR